MGGGWLLGLGLIDWVDRPDPGASADRPPPASEPQPPSRAAARRIARPLARRASTLPALPRMPDSASLKPTARQTVLMPSRFHAGYN